MMDRSRSNRYYIPKQRFDAAVNHHRGAALAGGGVRNFHDSNPTVTTSYRILCQNVKVGCVIGQSGSIIKSIRQNTGAWINVQDLIPGDQERVIEISDKRRCCEVEGRMNAFSPAQEALFMVHDRIIGSDVGPGDESDQYGMKQLVTRLVVSKMHVGCLLGKGGKTIKQMKIDTKTNIRVLTRDHTLPKCVSMSEEIVQIVGDTNAVKHAITIISSRLRESQHHERINFPGRLQSPERFFPHRTSSLEEPPSESRLSANQVGARGNSYPSLQFADMMVSAPVPVIGNSQTVSGENIVFCILCPVDKINRVVGESDGIINLLQTELGVAVKVIEPVPGADEQIIIISSDEGPDNELFPAQEALLHIQTSIVDLVPGKENIITTRLLVPSGEVGCLKGNNGLLSKMKKSGVNVQILPNEQRPICASGNDNILQIEGEIILAREALMEVTLNLRDHLYQGYFQKEMPTPTSATSPVGLRTKDSNESVWEALKQTENVPSSLRRFHGPLVTRSILEVAIPQHAVVKLSKSKLSQISELSGATIQLIENGSGATDNFIQISGTPEQAERAQSLLQGFILSTQEDGP